MFKLPSKIVFTALAIVAVISLLSLIVYAASGPISTPTKIAKTQQPQQSLQQKPGEVSSEESVRYKCSTVSTMRDRIKCRLNLTEENEYNYLPEECRALVNESRVNCVANYKKSQSCWVSLRDTERFECAKSAFGLVGTVASQKAACDGLTGTNRSSCILKLRDRVDAVVKFRIYNLEEKAQSLMQKGLVSEESATDFVTAMEQQKQNYNEAKTTAEKKTIIIGVQGSWQEFITNAKRQVNQ